MGIRMDQYIGLSNKAKELTADLTAVGNAGEIEGAWDPIVARLNSYYDDQGEIQFVEFVQAEPWSSGPMYFLALKDAQGNTVAESLWNEADFSQF